MSVRLTNKQHQALKCARANFGEISEGLLVLEGNGHPRNTLRSLVNHGLLVRREWIDEEWGYRYEVKP